MAANGRSAGDRSRAIPVYEMQKYYKVPEKDPTEVMQYAFESLLDGLRSEEKNVLNYKRQEEINKYGTPADKWYEQKGANFTAEMKKFDRLSKEDPERDHQLSRLINKELY